MTTAKNEVFISLLGGYIMKNIFFFGGGGGGALPEEVRISKRLASSSVNIWPK